jgi:hypothetical protein
MAMGGGMGQMIFGIIFNLALMLLFAPKPKDTISYGPRLDNLKPAIKDIQNNVINLTYGTTRVSGTVFWCSDLRETTHSTETEMEEGGKGGGEKTTHTEVTYTYDCDMAVGICEGPILEIRKIWANKELIYNIDSVPKQVGWLSFTIYPGDETQLPAPLLQAHLGYDVVSAHRGLAYVVFDRFQLDPFGRRVPQSIEFEVVGKGNPSSKVYKYPQIDAIYQDYGNDHPPDPTGAWNTNHKFSFLPLPGMQDSYIFPVSNSNGLAYARLDVPTSQITKFYAPRVSYQSLEYTANNPFTTHYVYLKVSYMGNKYRYVPAIVFTNNNAWQYKQAVYWRYGFYAYNLINNSRIGSVELPDLYGSGSFIYPYFSGIYNNSFNGVRNIDGTSVFLSTRIDTAFAWPQLDPTRIDNYGFSKDSIETYSSYNPEGGGGTTQLIISSGVPAAESFYVHLLGFPRGKSTKDIDCALNPYGSYTVTSYLYKIIEVHSTFTTNWESAQIKHENYTHSILDELEQDKACFVSIEINETINAYSCVDDSFQGTSTGNPITIKYPAILGPKISQWDADPASPSVGPPYDANMLILDRRAVFVSYIEDADYRTNNVVNITYWLRFTNGAELLSINWDNPPFGPSYQKIYRKYPYAENLPHAFNLTNHFYANFLTFNRSWLVRKSKPLEYYNDSTYVPQAVNQFSIITRKFADPNTDPNGYYGADIDNNKVEINNQAFLEQSNNVLIPSTAYWDRGLQKIYYSKNNAYIYSYDLLFGGETQELFAGTTLQNVFPYGTDFIGCFLTGGVYYIQRQITSLEALLGEIVEDISEKANIDLSLLDISDPAYNTKVYGYNISDDIKLVDALESLLMHYFIDAFESDWKIKYRTRKENIDNNLITTINVSELGVKELGENYTERYKITLREDIELPQSLTYTYVSVENGFSLANVIAIRNIDFNTQIKTSIKCPMSLRTTEAYSNSFRILFDIWRSTKEYDFRLPKKYSYIEPGDLLLLPVGASQNTNEYLVVKVAEITAISTSYLEVKAIEEDARNLEGLINDGALETKVNTLVPIAETESILLDTYPLYNKYTNIDYLDPRIYCTHYSNSSFWRGAGLYVSYDRLSFGLMTSVGPMSAPVGTVFNCTNVPISNSFKDTNNNITIYRNSASDFYMVSDDDYYYREGNLLAVLKKSSDTIEFIQYQNLEKDPNNSQIITFSNLNRGIYNSNYTLPISVGDTVILLPEGTTMLPVSTTYYNKTVDYKLVSLNQPLNSAQIKPFTLQCNWFKPYNVAHLSTSLDSGDILVSWMSRERNKPKQLLMDPDLIDPKEYTVKIYDVNNNLIRTATNVITDSYTYLAADIATDGFDVNLDTIIFKIQRKATFLEYNHDVIDEISYSPDLNVAFLQAISNNSLVYFLESSNVNQLISAPTYGTSNITYNNYNGTGVISKTNGMYGLNSLYPKRFEELTFDISDTTTSWTIAAWLKIDVDVIWQESYILQTNIYDIPFPPYDGDSIVFSTDNGWGNDKLMIRDMTQTNVFDIDIQYGKWMFVCVSRDYNLAKVSFFAKTLDGTYEKSSAGGAWNVWARPLIAGTTKLFTSTHPDNKHALQNLMYFNKDLYLEGGGNFSKIIGLYDAGVNKWQKR